MVYASFDGYQIWLAANDSNNKVIALEPAVMNKLIEYSKEIQQKSKQEFLKMHDKAVERSITEETYKESRAWDIKKEKKVSHNRNNIRK